MNLLFPDTWAWDTDDMLDDGTSEAYKATVAAKARRLALATCDSVTLEDQLATVEP